MIVFCEKKCCGCGKILLATSNFFYPHDRGMYGCNGRCIECCANDCKKWRSENNDKWNEYQRSYSKTNDQKIKHNRRKRKYYKENIKDPNYRLLQSARSICCQHLQTKTNSTIDLVGLSGKEWMDYLETMFEPGMTRENYGTVWHVDHIFPLSQALNFEHKKQLLHYLNTQPMFASENSSKGNSCIVTIDVHQII